MVQKGKKHVRENYKVVLKYNVFVVFNLCELLVCSGESIGKQNTSIFNVVVFREVIRLVLVEYSSEVRLLSIKLHGATSQTILILIFML
jgi:hypothetical protein